MKTVNQTHLGIAITAQKIIEGWAYKFTVPASAVRRGKPHTSDHGFTTDTLSHHAFDLCKTIIDYILGEKVTFNAACQDEPAHLITLEKGEPHTF